MALIDRNNLDIPEFINEDFLKKILQNESNKSPIEIKKIDFTLGCNPGENYCSMIYRAKVTYVDRAANGKNISLIIKYLAQNLMTEYFEKCGVFKREASIYIDAIPRIKEILRGADVAPRLFYFTKDPTETIVFEDATPLGYSLADRVAGLNFDHCSFVFEKLAEFHAASMQMQAKHPDVALKFKNNIMSDDATDDYPELKSHFNMNFTHLQKVVEKWDGFEEIAEKFKRFILTVDDKFEKSFASTDDEIKVLVHNDLWTNNILFKYETDTDKPIDLYFIDFQMAYYSSPAIDILHFLYTSPQYQVLDEKRDYLIEECYYKTLKSTLETLGYRPIPSLADLHKDIENGEAGGFMMAVMKLFLICMDKDKCGENNIDNLADSDKGEKIRSIGMSSVRFTMMMKNILRRMDSLGII